MDIPGENIRIPQPIRIVPPIPFPELKQRVNADVDASRIKVYLLGGHRDSKWDLVQVPRNYFRLLIYVVIA